MNYRENLPCNCPPPNAEDIDHVRIMYRLIPNDTPSEEDFYSLLKRKPNAQFRSTFDTCNANGVSLYSDPKSARTQPRKKFKDFRLCCLRLQRGAGKILKTYGTDHYTWWPFAEFDVLGCCEVQQSD